MIDKKVLRKIIIIVLLIVVIFIFIQLASTAARYVSNVSAEKQLDVAFYIMDNDFKEDRRMILEDLLPSEKEYEYTFSVSNNEGTKRSAVDMEYDVIITATTNLPLLYTVEKDGQPCIQTATIIRDDSNTCYKEILIDSKNNNLIMSHTEDVTDEFVIKVEFPKDYSTQEGYADLIENIKLEVVGRQIIDE